MTDRSEIVRAAEALGWAVTDDGEALHLSKTSPAGEPMVIAGMYDQIIKDAERRAYNFDAEEHVAGLANMRGENGVPSSLRALLEDADWQAAEFLKLAAALRRLGPGVMDALEAMGLEMTAEDIDKPTEAEEELEELDSYIQAAEELGWTVTIDIGVLLFERYSPLGDPLTVTAPTDNIAGALEDFAFSWDPEEHAAGIYTNKKNGLSSGLRALLADADWQASELDELAEALRKI